MTEPFFHNWGKQRQAVANQSGSRHSLKFWPTIELKRQHARTARNAFLKRKYGNSDRAAKQLAAEIYDALLTLAQVQTTLIAQLDEIDDRLKFLEAAQAERAIKNLDIKQVLRDAGLAHLTAPQRLA